jgi:hypothetical protein
MQQFLAKLLPELTVDVAHDEIPVSEIEGPAARRTTADSKPKRTSTSKKTSTRSKASSASKRRSTSSRSKSKS